MIRVAICDDDREILQLLTRLLLADPEIRVVATFLSAQRALTYSDPVDVWLVDVRMPGMSGFELARRLTDAANPPAVLMITSLQENHLLEALDAGASGYLRKDDSLPRFREAIRAAAAGLEVTSRSVLRGLGPATPASPVVVPEDFGPFVELITQGRSSKEMGLLLGFSESGIKKRLRRLFLAADVTTRTELVHRLHQRGWVVEQSRWTKGGDSARPVRGGPGLS